MLLKKSHLLWESPLVLLPNTLTFSSYIHPSYRQNHSVRSRGQHLHREHKRRSHLPSDYFKNSSRSFEHILCAAGLHTKEFSLHMAFTVFTQVSQMLFSNLHWDDILGLVFFPFKERATVVFCIFKRHWMFIPILLCRLPWFSPRSEPLPHLLTTGEV